MDNIFAANRNRGRLARFRPPAPDGIFLLTVRGLMERIIQRNPNIPPFLIDVQAGMHEIIVEIYGLDYMAMDPFQKKVCFIFMFI